MKLKHFWKTIGLFLLFTSAVFAEEFDPSSVRSPGCKPGTFSCGYIPSSKEIQDSIPLKRDFNSFDELPKSIDLSSQMPPVGNQGQQNSCVAWASGYAIKSYLLKNKGQATDYDPPFAGGKGNNVFSPAFIYNQQNGGVDQGLYYYKTMEFLKSNGVAPWSAMPYSDKDFRSQPSANSKKEALKYKIKSFSRLNFKKPDEIKRVLAGKNVVLAGMIIDDAFYKLKGSAIYDENGGQSYGGHAMTIVGYDDNKKSKSGKKGAFKLQNSWGTSWGDKGFGWVSYSMLAKVGQETYAIIDEPAPQNTPTPTVVVPPQKQIIPPTDIKVSKGEFDTKVVLTWNHQDLAVAYLIQRKEEADFYDLGYADKPSFTDLYVSPNSTYVYRILSIGAEEVSVASVEVEGFTAAEPQTNGNIGQVVGLTGLVYVTGNSPNVDLSWSELDGVTSYTIARSDSSFKWKNIGISKTPSFIDSSPKVGESNYYRVSALVQSKPSGDWSETVSVNVADQSFLPNQVGHLTATSGDFANKIILSWAAAPGASIYYLYRFDENAEPSGQFEISGTSYTDTDQSIQNGRQFLYTVIAANDLGYAEPSDVVFGKTDPGLTKRAGGVTLSPPKQLTTNPVGKDKLITLKWDSVKDSFEYYIYRKQVKGVGKPGKLEFVSAVEGKKTAFSETFPGNSGDLFLYSVRSKSEFGSESKDSNFVSVFWNEPKLQVKKRTMSLEELPTSFVGTWSSMYWNPKSGPQTVLVEIQGNGQDFVAKLKLDGRDVQQFKGTWSPGSHTLKANGFLFELSTSLEGTSLAQFQSVKDLENGSELSFTKDK
ncbi:C1 family peptidase [Leptospira brenneri]|uniref:Cysteine protease n=1 Tax=Leptospira brenneri TaxID=2023182 RepID=A0A2M9Y6G8_9LEPT|nr:C1 family peptidase [Leptospira brenneri]PJZ47151.1 cysteine protease [Leptospira brenneri]TGK95889.1 cysteine protease [Leptospira brenneri]